MRISEFSRETGLSAETVRFYVTKGLLKPRRGTAGGRNPYQIFSTDDVTAARMILLQKSLGYSLDEIAALNNEYRSGARSATRTVEVLRTQIAKLEDRRAHLDSALAFLQGKLAWIEAGKPGASPLFPEYECRGLD
ncbi:MerR family transcriptional regulator [Cupriavidus pauculus]|uniref:MerR family transcriptional regulator n=1 Tax=Cupriavidus pauculus TaxID=82633 RepID=UPI001EE1B9A3|nr:MerR family transcriptional regulator [Cupriavidus pauculus]GJG98216.1 MerR family transcriptional regulator [Cupriavidus pauculus]